MRWDLTTRPAAPDAEAVHAELYMEAYSNIDVPDNDTYYLCPIRGCIHKGDDFEKCPICFTPADNAHVR